MTNVEGIYNKKPMGVNQKRRCRDVLFLLLFIGFWIGMYIVAGLAVQNGDVRLLTDYRNQFCGYGDVSDKPNVYYLNPFDLSGSLAVCIDQCPGKDTPIINSANLTPNITICDYGLQPKTLEEIRNAIRSGKCGFKIPSRSLLNRCVFETPSSETINAYAGSGISSSSGAVARVNDIVSQGRDVAIKAVTDIQKAYGYIFVGIAASLIVCFIYLLVLRLFARTIIWGTLLAVNALFIGMSVWLYFFWRDSAEAFKNLSETERTDSGQWQVNGILAAFIVVVITAAIILLICIFLRKRITTAIQIIREASKAIGSMPLVVFLPVVMWVFLFGLLAYFLIILLFLMTPKSTVDSISLVGNTWKDSNISRYMVWYHIFGCLWAWGVISGATELTVAGGVATYYWTLDKNKLPRLPLISAAKRTVLYHMGSVCLGSFALAIVQIFRIFLKVLKWQSPYIKKIPGSTYVCCCIDCCLGCLTSIIKWINRQAYIEVAINGYGFCKSAATAFGLLTRNALRMLAVDLVSTFVLLLGKLTVVLSIFFAMWAAMRWKEAELDLTFTFIPALVVAFTAYVIAGIFFTVFETAIDTIFLSFLEDSERNDGSDTKPYYMSNELQRIIRVKNTRGPQMSMKVEPMSEF